jgi:hypothetical protein
MKKDLRMDWFGLEVKCAFTMKPFFVTHVNDGVCGNRVKRLTEVADFADDANAVRANQTHSPIRGIFESFKEPVGNAVVRVIRFTQMISHFKMCISRFRWRCSC